MSTGLKFTRSVAAKGEGTLTLSPESMDDLRTLIREEVGKAIQAEIATVNTRLGRLEEQCGVAAGLA